MLFIISISSVFAQYGRGDFNHIGISLGINQTNLMTDNFNVTPKINWTGGLSVRGNYYNSFAMVYGMMITENKFSIGTNSPFLQQQDVDMKIMSAQIYLLLSYRINESFFSIDFGPALMVNSKMKYDESFKNNSIVGNPLLTVQNIEDINPINFNLIAGFTGGFENFRLNINYQYGVSNILNNLNNDKDVRLLSTDKFKGHMGVISGGIILYL